MKERLLHTPEGVRDIYNAECKKKLNVQNVLIECIHRYGFSEIQTPTFEFFDIFSRERGTVAETDMFRFFDREGNTLTLRPDMTPPIARCAAKYFKDETLPIRLMYCGNTYKNNSSLQGKLKEVTQLGAELINDPSVEADAEMIAMTVDCLLQAGLKKFQVEIGDAEFFAGLVEEAGLQEEETKRLRQLIENKNLFGMEELLQEKKLKEPLNTLFSQLPELFGTIEKVKDVKKYVQNPRSIAALSRLEQLYDLLKIYEFEPYLTFDLGMLRNYNYYTGIIFQAFTYGTGEAIATGGRYDGLLGQFGKEAPAIGAALILDQLLLALSRQNLITMQESEDTLIVYQNRIQRTAIQLAKQFRKENMKVELYAEKEEYALQDYIEYAKRMGLGGILYLGNNQKIKIIRTKDETIQEASFADFLKEW